tara:strand:+ start:836 stop:1537 length:702 start_codon:yes stop_codon:yes gene_type:complete
MANPEDQVFDPEGSGYDDATGEELRMMYPLKADKPDTAGLRMDDYITTGTGDDQSHEAWVWTDHGGKDSLDWYKHGASFDHRTGRLLKGMDHPTIDKTISAEEERGYGLVKGDDGYYSKPSDSRASFERIIKNAPGELSQVISKQDGRTHYGLYTYEDDAGKRMFVDTSADQWHKPKEYSVDDWMYRNARKSIESGNVFSMDSEKGELSGWSSYKDLSKRSITDKVLDAIMGR